MESHRLSSPRSGRDGLFGVRVQVQGVKGQPCVVLNQAGFSPDTPGRCVDGRRSPPGPRPPSASSMLHYQKHPEILRPYDPRWNNPTVLPSVDGPEQVKTGQTAPANKPRRPLPAEGPEDLKGETPEAKAPSPGPQLPARAPNAVETESVLSVGQLISQFNSSQRRGRGGRRSRLDPEQSQRSRSLDSRRTSESSSSSSASSRASSLKGTGAPMYPPGSARARLLGGRTPPAKKEEEEEEKTVSQVRLAPSHTRLLDQSVSICRLFSNRSLPIF